MKVIHIECGLGNQMLDYAELLAVRYANPDHECYIENIIFNIKEAHKVISVWNGYELNSIFGIDEKNVNSLYSDKEWMEIIRGIEQSHFWDDDWGYSDVFYSCLNRYDIRLINNCKNLEISSHGTLNRIKKYISEIFFHTWLGDKVKKYLAIAWVKVKRDTNNNMLFEKSDEDVYLGHTLNFMFQGFGIEKIDRELREKFVFPHFSDDKNLQFAEILRNSNSVAIHARRGDFLSRNSNCYKYGYFKRAVKYIKKHVENPLFVFFCDPGSVDWCRENERIFGLDFKNDQIMFVDWNKDADSFRDMQLMSICKHNIITNSSFGWWGAYLNNNPLKITCSPDPRINTTHYF